MGKKCVRFDERITLHLNYHWSFAYREARKSSWAQTVVDRHRFQRRIQEVARILDPVINKMYNEYYVKYKSPCRIGAK